MFVSGQTKAGTNYGTPSEIQVAPSFAAPKRAMGAMRCFRRPRPGVAWIFVALLDQFAVRGSGMPAFHMGLQGKPKGQPPCLGERFYSKTSRSPSSALFFGEGSPTKIDYRKKVGTLILTSLLEDLGMLLLVCVPWPVICNFPSWGYDVN